MENKFIIRCIVDGSEWNEIVSSSSKEEVLEKFSALGYPPIYQVNQMFEEEDGKQGGVIVSNVINGKFV